MVRIHEEDIQQGLCSPSARAAPLPSATCATTLCRFGWRWFVGSSGALPHSLVDRRKETEPTDSFGIFSQEYLCPSRVLKAKNVRFVSVLCCNIWKDT